MENQSLLNDLQVVATNQLLEALVDSEVRMRRRVELLAEIVFELDARGNVVFLNPAWTALTGIPVDQVMDGTLDVHLFPEDRQEFATALRLASTKPDGGKSLIRLVHSAGNVLSLELSVVKFDRGHVGALHDITARKSVQDQLEYIAHYDILTKLPNRRLLTDRIEQALASCNRRKLLLAIAFLDLDGFKAINDRYGHASGDQLLISVARRLQAALREEDSIARIGGDEFVMVLVGLENLKQIHPILERLLQVASEPVWIGESELQVSASIGVTVYPQDDATAEHLIRHADQAMYIAKQAGKNRFQFFDVAHDAAVRTASQTLDRLRLALMRYEFVLHYQPMLNMSSNRIYGAEALIRWQHPDKGLIQPSQFLPIIESQALSISLGEWVIAAALAQLAEWTRNGQDFVISVNVGAYQLQHENFVDKVKELLSSFPLPRPGALVFEILETTALENSPRVSRIIRECQRMGIAFALDDFGTGYSSLTYLKQLPADVLKIDRSFVRDMLTSHDDLAIVEGVIALAKAFRRRVIAEGVESAAHMDRLMLLGCDNVQGFGVAPPMPPVEFVAWADAHGSRLG